MALLDRSKAKESGFGQVRKAILKFEGDVVRAEFGLWGSQLDENGKPLPPREFLDIETVNNTVLEIAEEPSMDITERFSFRVNCSESRGSFWVEDFLLSADENKILLPDGLIDKRVTWVQKTRVSSSGNPAFNSTNFVIESVKPIPDKDTPKPVGTAAKEKTVENKEASMEAFMEAAKSLAIGKTEAQFRVAASMDKVLMESPSLLAMAKSGLITSALLQEGALVEVKDGNKTVYQLPEA